MRLLAAVTAVALIGAATEARAADDYANGADLRCVVAMGYSINNPTYREAASSGLFYFLGRLEGRDPTMDLAKGLKLVSGMPLSQVVSEAQRCFGELKAKNEMLKAIAPETKATHRGVG
jgi:hypothetical protein